MDYRKFGECYYIRMDRDDEIISTILEICKKENIRSATFSGIGGCKDAEIQTFIPETGSFEEQRISGMLELVSLNGNVVNPRKVNCYCLFFFFLPRSPTPTPVISASAPIPR